MNIESIITRYLAGEKLAGENTAGPGVHPTDVCLLVIAASGVVCGLFAGPYFQQNIFTEN